MKNLEASAREHLENENALTAAAARQCRWHDNNFTAVTKKISSQIQNLAMSSVLARNATTAMAQR
jgi:hypothetical protein